MSRPNPRGGRRAGFTLIEMLVALVVFAVVAVVAQRGMVTARLGLERARSTLAAEQVARSLVETELDRVVRGPGEFTGATDGVAWTIMAEPIVLPLPPAPVERPCSGPQQGQPAGGAQPPGPQGEAEPDIRWQLLRVVVSVANGRAKPLRVETAHVVKDQP